MTKIAVTGCGGKAGRAIVREGGSSFFGHLRSRAPDQYGTKGWVLDG
jgi:hypothetical protein